MRFSSARYLKNKGAEHLMSKKRATHLKINTKDAQIVVKWFEFQEQNHPEAGSTSIDEQDIELLTSINRCIDRIKSEPDRWLAIKFTPKHCQIAMDWFHNVPECVADKSDADIHAQLGLFLDEHYSGQDQNNL